jgi:hypothetical protein
MAVFALLDRNRIMQRDILAVAMKVGDGNDEVEPVPGGNERGVRRSRFAHRLAGVQQHAGEKFAGEGRFEPARPGEELQFLPHLEFGGIPG